MTRKSRFAVLVAAAIYVFILWMAFRWGASQRYPEGSIFAHREAELRKRLAAEAAMRPQPERTPQSALARIDAAMPAYIAVRYDDTHVVFLAAPRAEPRFPETSVKLLSGVITKIAAPSKVSADLAGLEELWEPDRRSRYHLPRIMQSMPIGEPWILDTSPNATTAVSLERPVIAALGCSISAGFLAAPAAASEHAFSASPAEYFVIRRSPVESSDPPSKVQIGELHDWSAAPDFTIQLQKLLNDRMKQELLAMDNQLFANAENPSQVERPWPATSSRKRIKHWLSIDDKLERGQGQLDYDLRAFRLTPDGVPRLMIRARWTLDQNPVFLMSAWLRPDSSRADTIPRLLFADSTWSKKMRDDEVGDFLGKRLDFQTVLNQFDADHDGWAELLVHSQDGLSAQFALYLYTDLGLVPTKISLERDLTPPQSCLEQN